MNEELAKCPACDSTMMWPQPGNEEAICSNTDCGYQVNVWDHHVLARRAEVGRLVETLMDTDATYTAHLSMDYEVAGAWWDIRRSVSDSIGNGYGQGRPSAFGKVQAPTLLDALRALATKLGITDEKGATR